MYSCNKKDSRTNTEDILDALNWQITEQKREQEPDKSNNQYTPEEQLVIECIKKDMLTMDELILKTNLNINDLMVILTKLELNGTISAQDGGKYISMV